jgi:hypothetical protein
MPCDSSKILIETLWMGIEALIVATNVICSPNRTVAPTFSNSIPDCARAGCAFNRVERAITKEVRSAK